MKDLSTVHICVEYSLSEALDTHSHWQTDKNHNTTFWLCLGWLFIIWNS